MYTELYNTNSSDRRKSLTPLNISRQSRSTSNSTTNAGRQTSVNATSNDDTRTSVQFWVQTITEARNRAAMLFPRASKLLEASRDRVGRPSRRGTMGS